MPHNKHEQPSVPRWFYACIPYKLGEGLLITLLPLFVIQVIGGNVAEVGLIHSLISLAGAIAFIFWGNLSDRLKIRTPFLVVGIFGFVIFTSLISLGTNFQQVLLFSTFCGFFMAAVTPIASALILETVAESDRSQSLGRFNQISGSSFIIGVLVGLIYLQVFSIPGNEAQVLRNLLTFAGLVAFLSCILAWGWIGEPKKIRSQRDFNAKLLPKMPVAVIERRALFYSSRMIYFIIKPQRLIQAISLAERPLMFYYLCSVIFFFGVEIVYVPFPVFLTTVLGATNTQVLAIVLSKAVIETLLYVPAGNLLKKHRAIALQKYATIIRIGIFIILTLVAIKPANSASLIIVWISHLFIGITWSLISISGPTIVASLADKGSEAGALGMYNSMIGISTILGSLASGLVAIHFGFSFCFMLGTVLLICAAVLLTNMKKFSQKNS